MAIQLFVEVIIPLKLSKTFTYSVPKTLKINLKIGSRVIVQFGAKRVYTAVVKNIHQLKPDYHTKNILDVLDEHPIITPTQLKLYEWISNYYLCGIGEVLSVALPSGLKLSSESKIQLNPDIEELNIEDYNEFEQLILYNLKQQSSLNYNDIPNIVGQKNPYKHLKSLINKNIILLFEEVKDKFVPKKVKHIRLSIEISHENIQELLKQVKKKQLEVVETFLRLTNYNLHFDYENVGIDKKSLLQQGISTSSLNTLIKKGIFEQEEIVISRFDNQVENELSNYFVQLSNTQAQARTAILQHFQTKPATLLHGITGSGKTEIYIDLIQKTLAQGKQVLFLLPEIALTTQIVQRLQKVFGQEMGVYHSKFSANERVETWKGILTGKFKFVVGVRSAIFLPFDNLGLIIVDEEHETSYKQHDPAPYYHARDTALMLGYFLKAPILLGSATPSVESYYHALSGKWGLVSITERFGNAQLPKIIPVDSKYDKVSPNSFSFSKSLLNTLEECLKKNEQAILFQNRRGYAPFLMCDDCNHIPKCPSCDVSLTYHLHNQESCCHYCGYVEQNAVQQCGECGSHKMKMMGQGTEKIEDELNLIFPEAKIQRMDLDTTRGKDGYEKIIGEFAKHNIDFLIGTQMVSKGLDFDSVNTVAVFDFDRMVNFPNFRANERTYQMITQVSGRAGRREKQGRVLIQTKDTQQPILTKIIKGNYVHFYEEEIQERALFHYPPFTRLIKITIRHENQIQCEKSAIWLSKLLLVKLDKKYLLGPQEPIINKIRNQFLQEIMIKVKRNDKNLGHIKQNIIKVIEYINKQKEYKNTNYSIDIDPI